jgi:ribosomal-protein-alanine N-acetyltransferase
MDFDTLFDLFPVLTTPKLELREIRESDCLDLLRLYGDPDVGRFNMWMPLRTEAQAREKVHLFRAQFENRQRIRWGIVRKSDGVLMGDCAFVHFDLRSDRAEIGFNLAQSFWRQGYMEEAVSAVISFGFGSCEINRIDALVVPDNMPSRNLLEKLGFVQEGLLRQVGKLRGEYRDALIFGLLREDWDKRLLGD